MNRSEYTANLSLVPMLDEPTCVLTTRDYTAPVTVNFLPSTAKPTECYRLKLELAKARTK